MDKYNINYCLNEKSTKTYLAFRVIYQSHHFNNAFIKEKYNFRRLYSDVAVAVVLFLVIINQYIVSYLI